MLSASHFRFSGLRNYALGAAVVFALLGCSELPAAGPSAARFAEQAGSEPTERNASFILVDLSQEVLDVLARRPSPSLYGTFGSINVGNDDRLGPGDGVQVSIWEASSGGLFTAAPDRVEAGAKSITLPTQEIDRAGTIAVPYAGRIHLAGLTRGDAEARIVAALKDKAIQPQVLVTIAENRSNTVTVSGEGIGGARVPLSAGAERLLDVLAVAGGVSIPVHEAVIVLQRAGRSVRVPLSRVVGNPAENIRMRGDDTLTVVREARTFTALGSTGANAVVPFDGSSLTLDKALAKAGGLLNASADPSGFFLMRREPRSIARTLDPGFPAGAGQIEVNVVYRIDLRDPKSLFLAHGFKVMPDDILYVSGANVNDFERLLRLVGLSVGNARAARSAF